MDGELRSRHTLSYIPSLVYQYQLVIRRHETRGLRGLPEDWMIEVPLMAFKWLRREGVRDIKLKKS